jgi:16S rRNA (uracil1498-N3)-methyltransferase
MSTPRFYVPIELAAPALLALPEAAAHHAARVLRLRAEDEIALFNGQGGEYSAVIVNMDRNGVQVEVRAHLAVERESPLDVTLVQAVSSGDRMDLTIQKAVELGVTRIVPVESERSIVRLKGERARKRHRHWQQIAISACEQCGRNRVPEVQAPRVLDAWLAPPSYGTQRWMLAPDADIAVRDLPRPDRPIEVLIGPEGGFTDTEILTAQRVGYQPVRLGPRVLRTETAAPALLAVLQTLWGDF